MNYTRHNPVRYAPSSDQAREYGRSDFSAIARYLPKQRATTSVLEIGCGTGNLLYYLNEIGFTQCKGVEPDPELSRLGREILGLEITEADWLAFLEHSSAAFDIIIALDVLEHLRPEDCVAVLKATQSRLNPGGRLILRTPNAECPFVLPTYCGDLTHKTLFSPSLLRHVLREAGFLGPIIFSETRPFRKVSCILFTSLHRLFVRPVIGAFHWHFHGHFPQVITRNMYCVASRDLK